MNILLVYPKYPDTFWSFKYILKFISKKAAFPPLGLLTVSSLLPKNWNKRLVDLNVQELEDEAILWADYVFIGAMLVQKESILQVVARCNYLGKKVVAGGPAFTTQHELYKGVDYFVLNEGEVTIPMFVKDLEEGNLKHIYTSGERPNIELTPVPDWSLIDFKNYATMPVQYSRGCPFNCEFCDIVIMNGHVPRTKTPRQMVGEFNALKNSGWKGPVFIVDDNFIGNKFKVKQMLPYIIRWQKRNKYPFSLLTEASTNLADDSKLMKLMRMANFFKVFLGIETPNLESLKECGKYQNVTRNLDESVKIIHQNGMQVMGGFIVGFDNDNSTIFDSQISFIQRTGVVAAMVGLLNAIPKTKLWDRLNAENRLVKDSSGENTDGTLNFKPKMGKKKLIEGYKKILASIYHRKSYYNRIHTFLKDYKPTVKVRIQKSDIKALFTSMFKIGIVSNSRYRYWKLMIKTLLTKRKAIPVAIELAIYGHHFERVVKKIVN